MNFVCLQLTVLKVENFSNVIKISINIMPMHKFFASNCKEITHSNIILLKAYLFWICESSFCTWIAYNSLNIYFFFQFTFVEFKFKKNKNHVLKITVSVKIWQNTTAMQTSKASRSPALKEWKKWERFCEKNGRIFRQYFVN